MSFQPFAVQCQTCGSRLRVTDPAIVGTIAACPKCNSMVQIDRPGRQVAVGQSDVDSEAITQEAIVAGDAADVADSSGVRGFAGAESISAESIGAESIGAADSGTSATPPEWQSEGTRRSRQIALIVALSLSGLLSAVGVFSWFVRSWRQPLVSPQAEVSEPASGQSDTANDTAAQGDTAGDSTTLESMTSPPVSESPQDEVATSDSLTPLETTATSPEAPFSEVEASAIADLIPQSPIAASGPQDSKPVDDEAGGMTELPPELQKYLQVLPDLGVVDTPTLKAPPTMNEVKIEAAAEVGDDPLVAGKPKTLNLKADLAIELAFASEGYPLSDLMLLVSQITGVPIQVDWVSFDLAGIDIDARVPTKKGWQSARQLLEQTASLLGAEIREEESLLVLTLSDDTFATTMATVADLKDFGDSQASAKKVLSDFLQGDEIAQTRESQQLSGLAIEALRRMRGVEPKLDDQRLRRWARSSEDESAEWPLVTGGNPGPQMDTPITIAGLLRRTAKRNQATCVVNWYDANRRAAAPEQLVFPHATTDAGTTLDQTLSPFQLQVRKVDPQHWWVGTEATYDRLTAVVWTAPLGEARDTFTRRITAIMDGASSDVFRFAIDDESDRALLLLPRYIVRQMPKIAPAIARIE